MKIVMVAVAAFIGLFSMASSASAQEVRVTLTGVQARGGQILASLQTEGQFMQGQGAYNTIAAVPAENGDVTIVFEDVAPGTYAFSAIHDENSDFQLARSPIGIPTEGWSMHNGGALRGPPTFALVKIDVPAEGLTLSEPMIYSH